MSASLYAIVGVRVGSLNAARKPTVYLDEFYSQRVKYSFKLQATYETAAGNFTEEGEELFHIPLYLGPTRNNFCEPYPI